MMNANFSFDTAQKIGSLRSPKSIQVSSQTKDRPQFFSLKLNGRSSFQGIFRRLKDAVDVVVFDGDRQKVGLAKGLETRSELNTVLSGGEYFLKIKFPMPGSRFQIDLSANRVTAPDPSTAEFVGLTKTNQLAFFNSDNLSNIKQVAVTGLRPGESLLGIDFRPATGELFGLGSANRLYRLNTATGAATQVGDPFAVPLNGRSFGFDFNPTVDRIRVVSGAGQNLRLVPDTGAVVDADPMMDGLQIDGALNGATTAIMATAYTNSVSGAMTTVQYGIDAQTNQLFIQAPPNDGTQTLVGDLGINIGKGVSLDIVFNTDTATNTAYAASRASLFSIDLETGAATLIGDARDRLTPLNLVGLAVRG